MIILWVLSEMEVPISLLFGLGTIQVRRIGLFMDAYLLLVPVSGDFWKILLLYSQSQKIP